MILSVDAGQVAAENNKANILALSAKQTRSGRSLSKFILLQFFIQGAAGPAEGLCGGTFIAAAVGQSMLDSFGFDFLMAMVRGGKRALRD